MDNAIKLASNPRWLVSKDKLATKVRSSIVIATSSKLEAHAIVQKKGIFIDGEYLKVERYFNLYSKDQCNQCQGFGHISVKCTNKPKCRICALEHKTYLHKCKLCSITGRLCSHISPKCALCGEAHLANAKECKTLKALRIKYRLNSNINLNSQNISTNPLNAE